MANEFKIKKGLIVTGASGGTVVDIQGSQGQLFSVTDDLSGSIFAVSDISGVPILDVNSSGVSYFDGSVGVGTTSPTSLLEISKQLSAAATIDYPYTISSRDDANSINQVGGEGVGIKFRIAGNAATTPGDSLVGASIAAIREAGTDTDSSTGLGFFVTQNDETLDEALRINHDKHAIFEGHVEVKGSYLSIVNGTTGIQSTDKLYIGGSGTGSADSAIYIGNNGDGNGYGWRFYYSGVGSGNDNKLIIRSENNLSPIDALSFTQDGDSTFGTQAFATTATSSGDASSTLTTKGYVDGLITGATIYRGAWDPSGGGYGSPDLSGVTQTSGYYYICSAAGTAEPNGTGTEPDTWDTGDWVIYNDVSGTGQWQKIDNSSVLSGVGTGQTVALWEGAGSVTDSETLGNAPITVSGSDTAFAGNITAYTGGGSGSLGVGRTSNQSIKLYITDTNNSITAEQDSDGNSAHKFILNRVFDGTGANDFKIQKGGTDQFTLDTSANATFAGNISIPVAKKLSFGGGNHTYISEDIDDRLRFFVGGAEFMRFTEDTDNLTSFFQPSVFSSTVSATTFLGDLNGTINTATTGVTQTAGTNSTLIATTAYADAAAAAVPIGDYLPLAGGTLTGAFYAEGSLPTTPGMSGTGIGLGQASNYAHAQFSGSAGGYIDFSEPNVDWSGRIIYTHSSDSMVFYTAATTVLTLDSSNNATFTGNVTATTFLGNSTTQTAGDNSTLIATTAYADAAAAAVTPQAASLYHLLPNGAFTKTYAFTSTAGTWAEVMKGNDIITATGTFSVQVYVDDQSVGGTQYDEYYSGTMSWVASSTNDSGGGAISEIVLHRAGHAANTGVIYLRTRETTNTEGNKLKLEVMSNKTYTGSSNLVFKFVRLI